MVAFWDYNHPHIYRKQRWCGCPKGSICNCEWTSTQAVGSSKVEEKPKIEVTYKMYPASKYHRRPQIRNTRAVVRQFAPKRLQRFS